MSWLVRWPTYRPTNPPLNPPLNPKVLTVLRWMVFLGASWLVLRPALLVTISLDDFINPFFVFVDHGPSLWKALATTSRDVPRYGHFNYIGQDFASLVFIAWAYLIGWGVRYSLIYAATKFVVFIVAALVAARLLRTLSGLGGRTVGVWTSRMLVAGGLFLTVQLHVAWSLDPVGSFPLFGYLAAAIGLGALDLSIGAVWTGSRRAPIVAAGALCLAILYYEINVAMVFALAPVMLLRWRRAGAGSGAGSGSGAGVGASGGAGSGDGVSADRRALLRRSAVVTVPPLVMTMVLYLVASASSRGYTGTDVAVSASTTRVVARSVLGSLPASAWSVARDWLGQPFTLSALTVLAFFVVAALILTWTARDRSGELAGVADQQATVLLAFTPLIVWLATTLVQATTAKVRVDTVRIGYVYNYYAYGSIGIVLLAVLLAPVLPGQRMWRRARHVLIAGALTGALVQLAVNDTVQRVFDERLVANRDLLVAFSDQHSEVSRCAALQAWSALPFWDDYYREVFVRTLGETYRYFHGEPFCSTAESA